MAWNLLEIVTIYRKMMEEECVSQCFSVATVNVTVCGEAATFGLLQ